MANFNAFQWVQDGLAEELAKQGFGEPEPLEEEGGQAVMFATEEVAYSLFYDGKRFQLRSTTLSEAGHPTEWRSLSMWLFDHNSGEKSDADSILNDFLEVIRGPKRVAAVQQRRKRRQDEERNIDPLFFVNRLVNIFPEMKPELNEEKIVYGQVRFVTFIKEHALPRCEDLAVKYPESEPCKKLCSVLDDMYQNGDMDLRSIVTYTLLTGMNDQAYEAILPLLGEELQKAMKYSRKLKGKSIKPEKKKKKDKKAADVRLSS